MTNLNNPSELLPVHTENGKATVSAKQLYDFLGLNPTAWSRWCSRNIINNTFFMEGVDYEPLDRMSSKGYQDFEITLDFAKDLSMQAKTVKGNEARKYFIECERKSIEAHAKPLSPAEMLLQSVQLLVQQQKELTEVKEEQANIRTEIDEIKAKQVTSPTDYYTIAGYGSLPDRKIKITITIAAVLGKKATSICNSMGYMTGTVPDARFGRVKTYPEEVLKIVFDEYFK